MYRLRMSLFHLILATSIVIADGALAGQGLDEVELGRTSRGMLLIGGHEIKPPFIFTIRGEALRINGLRIRPFPERGRPSAQPVHVPEAMRRRRVVIDKMREVREQAINRGQTDEKIMAACVEALSGSGLAESVEVHGTQITVQWKGVPGLDYLGILPASSPAAPPLEEHRAKVFSEDAATILRLLNRDGLYVIGSGYELLVPSVRRTEYKHLVAETRARRDVKNRALVPAELTRDLHRPQPLDSLRGE